MERGVDARQSRRFTVRLSAEVNHGGKVFTATTRDLSVGGVCLESDRMVPEGDACAVGLFLVVDDVEDASQPTVEIKGKVAWSAPGDEGRAATMGIRFDAVSAGQLEGLTRFLKLLPES